MSPQLLVSTYSEQFVHPARGKPARPRPSSVTRRNNPHPRPDFLVPLRLLSGYRPPRTALHAGPSANVSLELPEETANYPLSRGPAESQTTSAILAVSFQQHAGFTGTTVSPTVVSVPAEPCCAMCMKKLPQPQKNNYTNLLRNYISRDGVSSRPAAARGACVKALRGAAALLLLHTYRCSEPLRRTHLGRDALLGLLGLLGQDLRSGSR
ncbi:unnamed protein product [Merluccius merluccius]